MLKTGTADSFETSAPVYQIHDITFQKAVIFSSQHVTQAVSFNRDSTAV